MTTSENEGKTARDIRARIEQATKQLKANLEARIRAEKVLQNEARKFFDLFDPEPEDQ